MSRNDDEHANATTSNHVPGTALRDPVPRRKPTRSSNCKSYGRHFCRAVHAYANIESLVQDGLNWFANPSEAPDEESTVEARREHEVFKKLLEIAPGFRSCIEEAECSFDSVCDLAWKMQKGAQCARSDDTKSLKGVIIDWIAPEGQSLVPPLSRNQKASRGFNHNVTGALLCPAELDWSDPDTKKKLCDGTYIIPADQWPVFMWKDGKYDPDEPWKGFLRSWLLIKAYKHIFTSPSSVDQISKAKRKGNAKLHNMTRVTPASIAYITMQVRFALSAAEVFTWNSMDIDSLGFYNSILNFLEDPEEEEEVNGLLQFWNQQIFPAHLATRIHIAKTSALARLKQSRKEKAAGVGRRA